jgi:hypothetical protein
MVFPNEDGEKEVPLYMNWAPAYVDEDNGDLGIPSILPASLEALHLVSRW